jgi:D-alanyl-D-alanine-carboxypeptidase/D-alanyl-D-alanine-endopeptidase
MLFNLHKPNLQAITVLLEAFLEQEYQSRGMAGLSIALVSGQECIWSQGFGFADVEQEIKASPETVYRIASLTKPFTVTMLMQLRDAGKLHLDEPVERFIPELKTLKSPLHAHVPITFRHLASHYSGLPRELPEAFTYQEEQQAVRFSSVDEMLVSLKQVELLAPPMAQQHYSNLGFALLGLALERIAGEPYTQYIVRHILQPLGMQSSGFEPIESLGKEMQERIARPYAAGLRPTTPTQVNALHPASGLFSTVEDMVRFIAFLFHDGQQAERQILQESSIREMCSPLFIDPTWQNATGMSWEFSHAQNETILGHSGRLFGYSADMRFIPNLQLGLVILTNTYEQDTKNLAYTLLEMILPVFKYLFTGRDTAEVEPQEPETPRPMLQAWQCYEGHYQCEALAQSADVLVKENRLISRLVDIESELVPTTEEHVFRVEGGPVEDLFAQFELDEQGKAHIVKALGFTFVRTEVMS